MSEKFDIMAAAGMGVSDIDESVLGMPLIQIVQKGSPEFDVTHKRHAERKIEGCKPGDVVFIRESKVLAKPLTVIPLGQTSVYTIWRPQDQGGGFIGTEPITIVGRSGYARGTKGTPNENKEFYNGNEAILTVYLAVMFDDGGQWKNGLLAFTSTMLRTARLWSRQLLSMKHPEMGAATPPIFSSRWLLNTKVEQNAKGSWFGWDLVKGDFLDTTKDAPLLKEAAATCKDGLRLLPAPNQVQALPSPASPAKPVEDDEAPF